MVHIECLNGITIIAGIYQRVIRYVDYGSSNRTLLQQPSCAVCSKPALEELGVSILAPKKSSRLAKDKAGFAGRQMGLHSGAL